MDEAEDAIVSVVELNAPLGANSESAAVGDEPVL